MIRKVKLSDAPAVAKIYNHHVKNTIVTFDLDLIASEAMELFIKNTIKKFPFFVITSNNKVVGYAYVKEWKTRRAYDKTAESSIYIDENHLGKGYGKKLYSFLINELKEQGFHTIIAGISLPNNQSVAIHEKFGFKKVAHFKEVGFKFEKWIDVGYWQLNF